MTTARPQRPLPEKVLAVATAHALLLDEIERLGRADVDRPDIQTAALHAATVIAMGSDTKSIDTALVEPRR